MRQGLPSNGNQNACLSPIKRKQQVGGHLSYRKTGRAHPGESSKQPIETRYKHHQLKSDKTSYSKGF